MSIKTSLSPWFILRTFLFAFAICSVVFCNPHSNEEKEFKPSLEYILLNESKHHTNLTNSINNDLQENSVGNMIDFQNYQFHALGNMDLSETVRLQRRDLQYVKDISTFSGFNSESTLQDQVNIVPPLSQPVKKKTKLVKRYRKKVKPQVSEKTTYGTRELSPNPIVDDLNNSEQSKPKKKILVKKYKKKTINSNQSQHQESTNTVNPTSIGENTMPASLPMENLEVEKRKFEETSQSSEYPSMLPSVGLIKQQEFQKPEVSSENIKSEFEQQEFLKPEASNENINSKSEQEEFLKPEASSENINTEPKQQEFRKLETSSENMKSESEQQEFLKPEAPNENIKLNSEQQEFLKPVVSNENIKSEPEQQEFLKPMVSNENIKSEPEAIVRNEIPKLDDMVPKEEKSDQKLDIKETTAQKPRKKKLIKKYRKKVKAMVDNIEKQNISITIPPRPKKRIKVRRRKIKPQVTQDNVNPQDKAENNYDSKSIDDIGILPQEKPVLFEPKPPDLNVLTRESINSYKPESESPPNQVGLPKSNESKNQELSPVNIDRFDKSAPELDYMDKEKLITHQPLRENGPLNSINLDRPDLTFIDTVNQGPLTPSLDLSQDNQSHPMPTATKLDIFNNLNTNEAPNSKSTDISSREKENIEKLQTEDSSPENLEDNVGKKTKNPPIETTTVPSYIDNEKNKSKPPSIMLDISQDNAIYPISTPITPKISTDRTPDSKSTSVSSEEREISKPPSINSDIPQDIQSYPTSTPITPKMSINTVPNSKSTSISSEETEISKPPSINSDIPSYPISTPITPKMSINTVPDSKSTGISSEEREISKPPSINSDIPQDIQFYSTSTPITPKMSINTEPDSKSTGISSEEREISKPPSINSDIPQDIQSYPTSTPITPKMSINTAPDSKSTGVSSEEREISKPPSINSDIPQDIQSYPISTPITPKMSINTVPDSKSAGISSEETEISKPPSINSDIPQDIQSYPTSTPITPKMSINTVPNSKSTGVSSEEREISKPPSINSDIPQDIQSYPTSTPITQTMSINTAPDSKSTGISSKEREISKPPSINSDIPQDIQSYPISTPITPKMSINTVPDSKSTGISSEETEISKPPSINSDIPQDIQSYPTSTPITPKMSINTVPNSKSTGISSEETEISKPPSINSDIPSYPISTPITPKMSINTVPDSKSTGVSSEEREISKPPSINSDIPQDIQSYPTSTPITQTMSINTAPDSKSTGISSEEREISKPPSINSNIPSYPISTQITPKMSINTVPDSKSTGVSSEEREISKPPSINSDIPSYPISTPITPKISINTVPDSKSTGVSSEEREISKPPSINSDIPQDIQFYSTSTPITPKMSINTEPDSKSTGISSEEREISKPPSINSDIPQDIQFYSTSTPITPKMSINTEPDSKSTGISSKEREISKPPSINSDIPQDIQSYPTSTPITPKMSINTAPDSKSTGISSEVNEISKELKLESFNISPPIRALTPTETSPVKDLIDNISQKTTKPSLENINVPFQFNNKEIQSKSLPIISGISHNNKSYPISTPTIPEMSINTAPVISSEENEISKESIPKSLNISPPLISPTSTEDLLAKDLIDNINEKSMKPSLDNTVPSQFNNKEIQSKPPFIIGDTSKTDITSNESGIPELINISGENVPITSLKINSIPQVIVPPKWNDSSSQEEDSIPNSISFHKLNSSISNNPHKINYSDISNKPYSKEDAPLRKPILQGDDDSGISESASTELSPLEMMRKNLNIQKKPINNSPLHYNNDNIMDFLSSSEEESKKHSNNINNLRTTTTNDDSGDEDHIFNIYETNFDTFDSKERKEKEDNTKGIIEVNVNNQKKPIKTYPQNDDSDQEVPINEDLPIILKGDDKSDYSGNQLNQMNEFPSLSLAVESQSPKTHKLKSPDGDEWFKSEPSNHVKQILVSTSPLIVNPTPKMFETNKDSGHTKSSPLNIMQKNFEVSHKTEKNPIDTENKSIENYTSEENSGEISPPKRPKINNTPDTISREIQHHNSLKKNLNIPIIEYTDISVQIPNNSHFMSLPQNTNQKPNNHTGIELISDYELSNEDFKSPPKFITHPKFEQPLINEYNQNSMNEEEKSSTQIPSPSNGTENIEDNEDIKDKLKEDHSSTSIDLPSNLNTNSTRLKEPNNSNVLHHTHPSDSKSTDMNNKTPYEQVKYLNEPNQQSTFNKEASQSSLETHIKNTPKLHINEEFSGENLNSREEFEIYETTSPKIPITNSKYYTEENYNKNKPLRNNDLDNSVTLSDSNFSNDYGNEEDWSSPIEFQFPYPKPQKWSVNRKIPNPKIDSIEATNIEHELNQSKSIHSPHKTNNVPLDEKPMENNSSEEVDFKQDQTLIQGLPQPSAAIQKIIPTDSLERKTSVNNINNNKNTSSNLQSQPIPTYNTKTKLDNSNENKHQLLKDNRESAESINNHYQGDGPLKPVASSPKQTLTQDNKESQSSKEFSTESAPMELSVWKPKTTSSTHTRPLPSWLQEKKPHDIVPDSNLINNGQVLSNTPVNSSEIHPLIIKDQTLMNTQSLLNKPHLLEKEPEPKQLENDSLRSPTLQNAHHKPLEQLANDIPEIIHSKDNSLKSTQVEDISEKISDNIKNPLIENKPESISVPNLLLQSNSEEYSPLQNNNHLTTINTSGNEFKLKPYPQSNENSFELTNHNNENIKDETINSEDKDIESLPSKTIDDNPPNQLDFIKSNRSVERNDKHREYTNKENNSSENKSQTNNEIQSIKNKWESVESINNHHPDEPVDIKNPYQTLAQNNKESQSSEEFSTEITPMELSAWEPSTTSNKYTLPIPSWLNKEDPLNNNHDINSINNGPSINGGKPLPLINEKQSSNEPHLLEHEPKSNIIENISSKGSISQETAHHQSSEELANDIPERIHSNGDLLKSTQVEDISKKISDNIKNPVIENEPEHISLPNLPPQSNPEYSGLQNDHYLPSTNTPSEINKVGNKDIVIAPENKFKLKPNPPSNEDSFELTSHNNENIKDEYMRKIDSHSIEDSSIPIKQHQQYPSETINTGNQNIENIPFKKKVDDPTMLNTKQLPQLNSGEKLESKIPTTIQHPPMITSQRHLEVPTTKPEMRIPMHVPSQTEWRQKFNMPSKTVSSNSNKQELSKSEDITGIESPTNDYATNLNNERKDISDKIDVPPVIQMLQGKNGEEVNNRKRVSWRELYKVPSRQRL